MIRPATPADEAAIRECAERAYARYVLAIGRRPAPMDADYATAIAAGQAHVTEDLAGFVVFYPEDDVMLLENVAVHPDAAGRGIGKALIAFCEDSARTHGLRAVSLYTNAKMVENLGIYPRLGYTETDRRTEDGFSRVFFEKPL